MLNSIAGLAVVLLLGSPSPQAEEEKVRALFDALVKAMTDKDPDAINRCFHAGRMIKELESRGFGTAAGTPEGEEKKVRALQAALPKLATNAEAIGAAWEKIRLLNLQVKPGGEEAEAFCRMTFGGSKTKVRFWLVKEETWWKVYDFEMQEGNVRLSVMMGAIWASMGGDEKTRRVVLAAFMALQKAAVQIASGEVEEARETLKGALASNPPAIMLGWLELVNTQALMGLGEYEEAVKAADRVLEHQKDMHVAHLMKAGALFELEDYEKCIEAGRMFVKLTGDDADAWELIGNAHDKLKQPGEAIESYRKGAASDDEEFANRLELGRLLVAAGKVDEARPVLMEASKNAPPEEDVFERAAELQDGAGDFAGMLAIVEERLKRTPDELVVLLWHGKSLRKLKRFEDAEKVLRPAQEKYEGDNSLAEELIFTLAQAGKDKEALEQIEKRAPEDPGRANFLRAWVHVTAGRSGKALEELRAMLEEDSDLVEDIEGDPIFEKLRKEVDLQILISRAHASREFVSAVGELKEKADWEGVLKLSRERSAASPDDPWGHFFQGESLRRLGRFFDSELAVKAAIAKAKGKPWFRDDLAKALAAQGKLDEALAVVEEVQASTEGRGRLLRVAVYALAKKSEPALKALAELLDYDAEWADSVEEDEDLVDFRKLEACRALLKKAKEKEKQ